MYVRVKDLTEISFNSINFILDCWVRNKTLYQNALSHTAESINYDDDDDDAFIYIKSSRIVML